MRLAVFPRLSEVLALPFFLKFQQEFLHGHSNDLLEGPDLRGIASDNLFLVRGLPLFRLPEDGLELLLLVRDEGRVRETHDIPPSVGLHDIDLLPQPVHCPLVFRVLFVARIILEDLPLPDQFIGFPVGFPQFVVIFDEGMVLFVPVIIHTILHCRCMGGKVSASSPHRTL